MPRSKSVVRWLVPALIAVAWLALAGPLGSFSGKLASVSENDSTAFLPSSAESTRVTELQAGFRTERTLPVILLWESGDGALDGAQLAEIGERTAAAVALAEESDALVGEPSPPIPSDDGAAAQVVLPFSPDLGDVLGEVIAELRDLPAVDGATAYVTGPGAVFSDFAEGFSGIDGLLLVAAFGVVLLILLVVYRSPLLPLLVIGTAGMALVVSLAVVYFLADQGWITVNGQSQGIASILVVGAATDYGLLLVARYREELRLEESKYTAMRIALRQSWEPIVASGATVVLGVLCLLFSDLGSNRGLGPVSAVCIAFAMLAALTFLPAVLVLFGRAAFWPFRPRHGVEQPQGRGWQRVAAGVGRRPARVLLGSVALLLALAAFAPTFDAGGIALSDAVRGGSPSATGQEALARHFEAGGASPAVVITPADDWQAVAEAARGLDGVIDVVPFTGEQAGPPGAGSAEPVEVDGLVRLDATLADAPDSEAAQQTVTELRTAVRDVDPEALVGGSSASDLDTQESAARDLAVIVPLVLLVITVVLALLLRALVAPILLVATVALSVLSTVGVSALVFDHLFGFPGSDPQVLLIGFVFLVALGIDYNIFLMTRAREESMRHGTRDGVLRALAVTGGVITSAGLVLAATFGALTVLPLVILIQLGFLVGFGVLLDTFLVRSLLVPAAVHLIGDRVWWPGRLATRRTRPEPERELERV
ncbi:MMPL family transporter [Geodermatophilus sabuli]|uniref:Putative drug exporter of the RND superfamily n=1 Tax=Geodermatophilus sabuli TaxID=1564158 RepID=A0A285EIA0_9ACTN|nr:MMPL family transporter [Geodermatophilus sabuli]MBB3086784.1 RND superfamily putative drug exporter [Geodermatophilus sabuli]SNX98842.1 putative drug exporter of the RND superfamily [Geodermatophilus sabuli]